jgi:hypothetical protein
MIGSRTTAALERAELAPPSAETGDLIQFGLVRIQGSDEDVLEVTEAFWQTESHGGEGVAILTREMLCLVLAPVAAGILRLSKTEPICVAIPFTEISDLVEDDKEMGGAVIFFFAEENFILRFERTAERDRFCSCIFAAHRGEFSRWGMQLDRGNFPEDFTRFHAELVAAEITDPMEIRRWIESRYGDFAIDSALGLAESWRSSELQDASDPTEASSRIRKICFPWPWVDVPESHRTILDLGEQLFDAGMLDPPYDERSLANDDPLSSHDIGPRRLLALMIIAFYARKLRDPRAEEFIEAAKTHLGTVPPSVFSPKIHELWGDIAPLPTESDEGPLELDIWEDSDVKAICTFEATRVVYDTGGLTAAEEAQVDHFLRSCGDREESGVACVGAALAGVGAFEELSPMCPLGWRKLIVYQVSDLAHEAWRQFRLGREAALLAEWIACTIEANGWGADGNATPLGQQHSFSIGLASETGIGIIVIDPETGLASPPTGAEARIAARQGAFS